MQIKIGTTSKRINSTSQTFTSSTTLTATLKEATSIHDPTFIVKGITHGQMYNFASYGSLYYWVDNVISITNDISEVVCHLDPLATFKTAIGNTFGFVEFGDSSHFISYRDDKRFGPEIKFDRSAGVGVDSLDLGFLIDDNQWTIIVTSQCSNFSYASVCSFAMDWNTFNALLRGFSGVVYSDITSWSANDFVDIIKNYATRLMTGGQQAMDNIRAIYAVPLPLSDYISISVTQLGYFPLGPYQITLDPGHTVYQFDPALCKSGNGVLSLGRPLINGGHEWLNLPKYCSIKITHPCGYLDINDPSLIMKNNVYAWYSIGYASGEYTIRFTSENSKDSDTIALVTGQVGNDLLRKIPNTNMTGDSNLHNSIDAPVMGAFMQNFNPGSAGPNRMSGGTIFSGYSGIKLLTQGKTCFLDTEYYYPAIMEGARSETYTAYCNEYGYPVGTYMKIGDISGFCQCSNANVGNIANATEGDKATINNYLNNGIYIES